MEVEAWLFPLECMYLVCTVSLPSIKLMLMDLASGNVANELAGHLLLCLDRNCLLTVLGVTTLGPWVLRPSTLRPGSSQNSSSYWGLQSLVFNSFYPSTFHTFGFLPTLPFFHSLLPSQLPLLPAVSAPVTF